MGTSAEIVGVSLRLVHTMIKLHFISVYKVNPKSIITPNTMMKTPYNDCYCIVSDVVSKLINLYNLLSQICVSFA